jgi:hypothetical protein
MMKQGGIGTLPVQRHQARSERQVGRSPRLSSQADRLSLVRAIRDAGYLHGFWVPPKAT